MIWKVSAIYIAGIAMLICTLSWQTSRVTELRRQLSAYEVINKTTQSAITLHYQVSFGNIKAKQLEDSEHVKVKTVIKTVLKDNECANTAVPDDVVSELHKYKRGIESRSVSTDTSAPNR